MDHPLSLSTYMSAPLCPSRSDEIARSQQHRHLSSSSSTKALETFSRVNHMGVIISSF